MNNRFQSLNAARRGLSIMEVLFAIAVLTIGMLGVASILPVATNNAANTLRTDRAVEEVNNRVATDLARLRNSFESIIVANNSLSSFNAGGTYRSLRRFMDVSTFDFRTHLDQYDPGLAAQTVPPASAIAQPYLPDAFCIDPWFLSASTNLRDDTGGVEPNGYDRTVFPCYDPRYIPYRFSPSDPISGQINSHWDTPRFTRVSIPHESAQGLLSSLGAERLMRQSDDFSVVIPEDTTRGPGLFVQRAGNAARSPSRNTVSSRFSSIVMMARSDVGSNLFNTAIVSMQDREVVTVIGGETSRPITDVAAFNLDEYVAYDPTDETLPPPTDDQLLYSGEQIGYVSFADRPLVGGAGEFAFRTSRFVVPDVSVGDWILLMRRDYTRPLVENLGVRVPGQIIPGRLNFAWFRVREIVIEPTLVQPTAGLGSGIQCFETRVSVTGPDWVFHPSQVNFGGVYAPPYSGFNPTWATPPEFNFDNMAARGSDPNGTNPVYEHQDYGTIVTLVPSVINVRTMQIQL
ncbi:MAG: hypothetical protein AAF802_06245 [Planctomycetota bacterium]